MKKNIITVVLFFLFCNLSAQVRLQNENIDVVFSQTSDGYKIEKLLVKDKNGVWQNYGSTTSGEYLLLFSAEKPSEEPLDIKDGKESLKNFPEEAFKYVRPKFQRAISEVPMNTAGETLYFYPDKVKQENGSLLFTKNTEWGQFSALWSLDSKFSNDINVKLSFTPSKDGYYSMVTPTIATVKEKDLGWATVPGWFQGNTINKRFINSYAYAQELPKYPVLCRESTTTTMASIMSTKNGLTLAVIPEAGQDRDPYEKDKITQLTWRIALSHMNRKAELTPTAYSPVLGQVNSEVKAGEMREFKVRYTLQPSDWYEVYKHAIYDVYKLDESLKLKSTKQSLVNRVLSMHRYVMNDTLSLWRVEDYNGVKIGAQSYLGGVVGSDKDAMKNSDMAAVWMLAQLTDDKELKEQRLPYMRNFKAEQQQKQKGFFQGAARGQYYLSKKKDFVEEWGSHFEPIGLTYYTMLDIGNILLFEPEDKEMRSLLRLGADRLLAWQKKDGSFEVAYDRKSTKPIYTDIKDLRPTFYGLVVAYKMLGDKKYLDAAVRGADWFVKNAVEKGSFLGVCGDARFVNDFATGQSAQVLLEMYDLTNDGKYLDAAVNTAKIYTSSIYTHPIPSKKEKKIKGKMLEDWEISQVGWSFEHGGSMGSAVGSGPISLTSHCGMFVRMYELTNDKLFLDLARHAALGRDAHMHPDTKVGTYYWIHFDRGPGPFPHHAWWHIGWIMDYVVAEVEMRSNHDIEFPRGFATPKVGPQLALGHKKGVVYGDSASLVLRHGLVECDNPNMDFITAVGDSETLYVMLLNSQANNISSYVSINPDMLGWDGYSYEGDSDMSFHSNNTIQNKLTIPVSIPEFGLKVLRFKKSK